jgi:hypothetical protein
VDGMNTRSYLFMVVLKFFVVWLSVMQVDAQVDLKCSSFHNWQGRNGYFKSFIKTKNDCATSLKDLLCVRQVVERKEWWCDKIAR